MRKHDKYWLKKCMENQIRDEDRRPVGGQRKTCLDNMEADITEERLTEKTTMTGRIGDGML